MKKFMKRLTSGVTKMAGKFNKKVTMMVSALAVSFSAMAGGGGGSNPFASGITEAQTQVQGTFSAVSRLMLIIGAVIGVVGAIRIYIKWNNGDQDVTKSIIAWAGAALFLVISGTVIGLIFNVA